VAIATLVMGGTRLLEPGMERRHLFGASNKGRAREHRQGVVLVQHLGRCHRGGRWGRGFGWGPPSHSAPACGPAYAPDYGPEDGVAALKDQARYFEEALQDIKKHIEEIESGAEKD
jgi:hypothetical protein